MQPYNTYKDTGIEWLGKVPEHWEIIKGKYVWKEHIDLSTDGLGDLLSVSQYDGVTLNKQDQRSESLVGYKKVQNDDLVINIMLAWLGGLGLSAYNGLVSPAYSIFKPIREINTKYFHYLYRTSLYLDEFARKSTGVVPSRWRMYGDDFGQVWNILPPLSEQTAIATFLDSKCEQLDRAIAQKERVISLLNERRQITIQRAVARGLNPDAPLRHSGIEWIGEIPEHWEVKRLKSLFSFGKGLSITKENLEESGVPVINYGQVHSKLNTGTGVNDSIIKYVNEAYLKTNQSSLVKKNDFIFADTSEDIIGAGNCAFIDVEGELFAGYHSIILRSKIDESTKYFAYLFLTDCWRIQIRSKVTGIKVYSITKSILNQSTLIIPPISEQQEIATYLDGINEKIDRAISLKRNEIARLKEYKQTLINSAVTGKIKIG